MRVLVVHNQLWAHYKSCLFAEINRNLQEHAPDAVFQVAQIALYESSRKEMKGDALSDYVYPYEVLFRKSLDEVGLAARIPALFRVFRKFRPTVLNVTGYFDWAQVLLMCYARWKGVKVVLSSESSAGDHVRSVLRERVKRWIVNRADAYFCFGKSSVNYLLELGVPPRAIKVANAAVIDEKRIRKAYEKAVIKYNGRPRNNFIYVGRLAEEKNLRLLLEAYELYVTLNPENAWGLLLVGGGPLRKELEHIAAERLPGKVRFAGGVPWYEVPEWLARAEVFVLPSKSEPWGLVVNEAMVCGLPVLVSERCGCVDDLVQQGVNGFIFDPADKKALAARLGHFSGLSGEQLRAFSEASVAIVAHFAVEKVAGEMVSAYKELSMT